jgi:hypothetical protein
MLEHENQASSEAYLLDDNQACIPALQARQQHVARTHISLVQNGEATLDILSVSANA